MEHTEEEEFTSRSSSNSFALKHNNACPPPQVTKLKRKDLALAHNEEKNFPCTKGSFNLIFAGLTLGQRHEDWSIFGVSELVAGPTTNGCTDKHSIGWEQMGRKAPLHGQHTGDGTVILCALVSCNCLKVVPKVLDSVDHAHVTATGHITARPLLAPAQARQYQAFLLLGPA